MCSRSAGSPALGGPDPGPGRRPLADFRGLDADRGRSGPRHHRVSGAVEPLRYVRVFAPWTYFGGPYGVDGDRDRWLILTAPRSGTAPTWLRSALSASSWRSAARQGEPSAPLRALAVTGGRALLCALAMTQGCAGDAGEPAAEPRRLKASHGPARGRAVPWPLLAAAAAAGDGAAAGRRTVALRHVAAPGHRRRVPRRARPGPSTNRRPQSSTPCRAAGRGARTHGAPPSLLLLGWWVLSRCGGPAPAYFSGQEGAMWRDCPRSGGHPRRRGGGRRPRLRAAREGQSGDPAGRRRRSGRRPTSRWLDRRRPGSLLSPYTAAGAWEASRWWRATVPPSCAVGVLGAALAERRSLT